MRVCTWNIQLGLRLNDVVDAIETRPDFKNLDLLALQECSIRHGREDAQLIAEAMGEDYAHFQATAQVRRGRAQANALIWRRDALAPDSFEVLKLQGTASADLHRAERTLLRAARPQPRIALRVEAEGLRVYVIHLDVIGYSHRFSQFDVVMNDMAARPTIATTLVMGDLNTIGSLHLPLWRRLSSAARAAGLDELTRKVRWTHRTRQKLDAIFLGSTVASSHRAWSLDLRASDHMPVFADIHAVS